MLPRIQKVESGKVHINGEAVTDNFFLHPKGFELLEKAAKIGSKDLERMMLHEPEIAVFGIGFKGKVKIENGLIEAAKKNMDVHVLSTPEAIKKFQEYARKGKKVVAHIHVSE
jgi:hypothetical protein